MKHLKTLGLLAVAAASLTAFAAGASASTLTSPTGTSATSLTMTAGAMSFDGAFTTITCNKSHIAATVTSQGAVQTVKSAITTFTLTECNFPMSVKKGGTLEFHSVDKVSPHSTCEAGTGKYCWATLTSSGTEIEYQTSVGTCVLSTSATSIGTVTGTEYTGATAKLDISGKIPRTAGNFLCGSSVTWTGSYTFDIPDGLWIDE